MDEYGFGVFQDGIMVAAAYAVDRERAQSEAHHYALMYGQGGPVVVRELTREEMSLDDAEFEP